MKMTVVASALVEAFSVASSVTPKAVTPNGVAGFLLKVEGDTCHIYSRDVAHVAKTTLSVTDGEDGSAVYPLPSVAALKYLGDQEIVIRSYEEEGAHMISYESSSGASSVKVTVDPDLFLVCDTDIQAARERGESTVLPAGVLRHMLGTVKPFAADLKDSKAEEHFRTVQLFDASLPDYSSGNGYMYAATGIISCSAYCDTLEGKSLAVHVSHVPQLIEFLSAATGNVTILHGENMEFVETEDGKVFGFLHHHKTHTTFRIYPLSKDGYVLRIPKRLFQDAVAYARSEMDPKENKVRLQYTIKGGNGTPEIRLSFEGGNKNTTKTFAVPVAPSMEDGVSKEGGEDFSLAVNIDHITQLFSGVTAHEAELRVSLVVTMGRTSGLLRTRDTYRVDDTGKVSATGSHSCTVYRFAPSRALPNLISDFARLSVLWKNVLIFSLPCRIQRES